MIKNSYQIFNCKETNSSFKLLNELYDINTEKPQEGVKPRVLNEEEKKNKAVYDKITSEIKEYHDNSKLDISIATNIIDEQPTINNKFIFKDGYYFCSYLYKHTSEIGTESIYISEPIYEYKNNPICSNEDFTNIVIKNTIPLNLNIIGVIYYYKFLFDKSECKSNVFTYNKDKVIIHTDKQKYIIDIVFYNTLHNNIYYELTYMFYKNVNFENLTKNRFKNKLKYIHFDLNNDEQFLKLSNTIEKTIYNETNTLILNLNKTKKKLAILLNLKNTTQDDSKSLYTLLNKISKKNSNVILNCNNNKYTKHLLLNQKILLLIEKISKDFTQLLEYIKLVESYYEIITESTYELEDFSNMILNENTFNSYKAIFTEIIEKRGSENIENKLTIYGLKPLIIKTINSISDNINELNNSIIVLQNTIGTTVSENNELISNLFTTIQNFLNFDINMNQLNQNVTTNKLALFMKYTNQKCTVYKNKILPIYLKNTEVLDDYTIEFLPEIFPSYGRLYSLDLFKINKDNILKIYDDIDEFYNYLGKKNTNMTFQTLYDLFFITNNRSYDKYTTYPHQEYKTLKNKYTEMVEGDLRVKNQHYNLEIPPLPKMNANFMKIYDKRKSLLQITKDIQIDTYFNLFSTKLSNIKNIYTKINSHMEFSRQNITNICKTANIMNEYNKHVESFIAGTKMNINSLQAQRNAKRFENLSLEEQKYIKLFLKTHKTLFSTIQKYTTNNEYFTSNNTYNISIRNFTQFIDSILTNLNIENDDMDILNTFFNLRNSLFMKTNNYDTTDEFIVIIYCFCISMLSEYPFDFFKTLFHMNKNQTIKNLFEKVLHNKLHMYIENNTEYIKIISIIDEITLSDYTLNNTNIENTQKKLINIKEKLVEELKNPKYINIQKKLAIIQYFITNKNQDESKVLKLNTNRGQFEMIDRFFKNTAKFNIINFNQNINTIIDNDTYYVNKGKNKSGTKYCVNITKNDTYDCTVCDFTKKSVIRNLRECPPNLPYNIDSNISSHINPTSDLSFEQDLYRIFSYVSEPKKELIYKRGRVIYGIPNKEKDSFKWYVNKGYKNYILLNKTDDNVDDTVIIKSNKEQTIDSPDNMNRITNNLDIINKDISEFYLNNFFIQNVVSEANINNPIYKFPNSHQLYIKKENNYYYVYFIEDDIKYYMYLNIEKNKTNYDIIFREDTTQTAKPFIKNNAKWRFVRDIDYIENIFENARALYNIRSKIYFNINDPDKINGLLAYDNTCYTYDVLLSNFLNNNYDLINNTKFKFTGYNNNYNIDSYIKNEKSVFKDINIIQFLNHNKKQERIVEDMFKKNKINQNEYNTYKSEIDKLKKVSVNPEDENDVVKITYYLLKNPVDETYLYLDTTRNIVEFVQLYEDNFKENTSTKLSPEDTVPDNFLWMTQISRYNDNIIKSKVTELQTKYNTMLDDSITNMNKNIKTKINKTKAKNILTQINNIKKKAAQTGGNILNISTDNISKINTLVKQLKYIKYNDYKLLLKQLDIIKTNSKQVLSSNIEYNNVKNRMIMNYIDHISNTSMNMYIYFKQEGRTRYVCNVFDILNIKTINFNVIKPQADATLNKSDIEIVIDNNELNASYITLTDNNTENNIIINIPENIKEFSQMFIYIEDTELILNVKRDDVHVYYNRNPIYNKLSKTVIKNTNKNSIFSILNSLNLGKSNKNIYDFSIQLANDQNGPKKIHNIDEKSIVEYITSYNNKIGNFYIKKNKLINSIQYNSKIFYISNDKNILYITIHNNSDPKQFYDVPCTFSTSLKEDNLLEYVCRNIYIHIKILNIKNNSAVLNKIFDYITILYKNNKYEKLAEVLNMTKNNNNKGFILNIQNKKIDIYIDVNALNARYQDDNISDSNGKIPNKITILFNRMIKNKFIHFDMKFTDFMHLKNLTSIIPNLQFIKLNSLSKNSEVYQTFINNIVSVLQYIKNIKNNIDENNVEDAFDLRNIDKIISNETVQGIIKYYLNITGTDNTDLLNNNEIKLYLYAILNSNTNITNYIIDLVLTLINIIQEKYNEYSEKINIALKSDPRFLDCIYKPASFIDILYNAINYFSDYETNIDEPLFHKLDYGFYYRDSNDKYVNFVLKTESEKKIGEINEKYLVSYKDLIDNYNKIYPQLSIKKIKDPSLNKQYTDLYINYKKQVDFLLNDTINMKYTNIKINRRREKHTRSDSPFKNAEDDLMNTLNNNNDSSDFIDYNNIKFNTNSVSRTLNKGDVIRYKFVRNTTTNKLFNTLNLLLPYKKIDNKWSIFNDIIDITYIHNDIYKLVNKKLNIYSISTYNEIFKSDLVDTYIKRNNLLLKQVLPFENDYSSVEVENSCYIKLVNNDIYLYLNKYKYKVGIRKLINSDLYLIYRTIHNINYYIQFVITDDSYDYKWVKEDINLLDNITNKLLFINITTKNITDTTDKIDVSNSDMLEIEYLNRFSNSFSNVNKFINNIGSECQLENTYYTIHSKKFNKIIYNNNIVSVLDVSLNNIDNTYIMKDRYSKINEVVGNFKYYLTNNECNSYIIYNSFKNVILDNNFEFVDLGQQNITLSDVIKNINNYKNYSINLKYLKEKDIYYQLNEDCIITKKMSKIRILNKSNGEKIAEKNKYFIYVVDDREVNLFQKYIDQTKITEYILEEEKCFHVIPLNNINKKQLLEKNKNTFKSLDLSLIPISPNSDYYVIKNNKNEYLQADNIIQFKKPLRINVKFVLTNKIDSSYLWYLKKNVENLKNINISTTSNKCMIGGQTLLLNNNIKKDYLEKQNKEYNEGSKYRDLCHNNTNLSFINHNIETEDDVSYLDCRKKCENDNNCVGFSVNDRNGSLRCNTYENKNENSIIFYDCNKSLTDKNHIGEIKNNENIQYHKISLTDNNLYYIISKTNESSYVTFDKINSVFKNKNNIYCAPFNADKQDIYSDNIFKLNVQKNNVLSGNIKFISLMSKNKHILGSYKDNANNIIDITYDLKSQRYVWNHIADNIDGTRQKWYLENTNNIYEYIVNEGKEGDEFYCKYYKTGYKTLKILKDFKNIINGVLGPESVTYTKMYTDKNVSIFKYIKNLEEIDSSNTYDGNIFAIKANNSKNFYNLYTIIDRQKHYLYLDVNDAEANKQFIKLTKNTTEFDNSDKFLWKFDKYSNKMTQGHSYEKILVGGDNPEFSPFSRPRRRTQTKKQTRTITGGVRLNDLVSGNSYYLRTQNDEYMCANKHYKDSSSNETKPIIAISIDSELATDPNKHIEYNKKFVRASIDLSDSKYKIFKKHSIDDDILWKLIKVKEEDNDTDYYKFYNIKHNIYVKFSDSALDYDLFEINSTASSIYYNLKIKTESGSKIAVAKIDNSDKIYNINSIDEQTKNRGLWEFINPDNYENKNPYSSGDEYMKLEDGKVYRIINEGVKQNEAVNTYLTINELENEMLIPYNEKLFTGKISEDPTLWKCVINEDNTYSFILLKNNKKLGDSKNNTSLFKNVGNKLEFKNLDYTINKEYLTDKFYVQHSTNQYYNIINSKNLNYNICGFSNDINTYDKYNIENIKYTHKVANNSEWVLTCKLLEQNTNKNIFSNEPYYYLTATKDNKLNYSFSYKYNEIYNDIYIEEPVVKTDKNILNNIIIKNSDTFKKNKGFTLHTQVLTKVGKFGNNNFSIILTNKTNFYTIRFINYDDKMMLVRINENAFIAKKNDPDYTKQMRSLNASFDKLDFYQKNKNSAININMNLCAPDIYTELNIFKLNGANIHLTYDNEYINIYVNNTLVTFFRISTSFTNIYYTSNNLCTWNNTKWWKHDILIDIPLWRTTNIDNFINNKPGIKFESKVNPNTFFECYIEQESIGFFYVRNKQNEYLSLVFEESKLVYETKWVKEKPTAYDNCLWKLYDTNINIPKYVKVLDDKNPKDNLFLCAESDIAAAANTDDIHWSNFNNSTNLMLKAKINKSTKQIDEMSNYEYSVIDINTDNRNINNKICTWTHNANGHTSVDYGKFDLGSHFTTDIWNIQSILGVFPSVGSKYIVKYKNNIGTVRLDNLMNKNYGEFGVVPTTVQSRWDNWNEVKEFNNIKSQDNIYVDNILEGEKITNNVCLSLNDDGLSASCGYVTNSTECSQTERSLLYIENSTCDDVLYKNYKLLKGTPMQTGGNKIKGGSVWIKEEHFYLNNILREKEIFNNVYNITYDPRYDEKNIEEWTWTTISSRNIIYNKILNNFKYDGYIEDEKNKIIRAVILPKNYILFYYPTKKLDYVKGKFKAYNCSYKNITVTTIEEYFSKYNNYFINIETNTINKTDVSENIKRLNKYSKCHDLIKKNICIPTGTITKIAKNVRVYDNLLNKFEKFQNTPDYFRIVTPDGKYLSDIFVNNSYYCKNVKSSEIIFQGPFNSINIHQDKTHLIHTLSKESLWNMMYDANENTYKIENVYTGKHLHTKNLYIEFAENKYFKQQIINKNNSTISYSNEDLYYIYFINDINEKEYIGYKDMLINNKYNNSSKLVLTKKPVPLIIKKAKYNLDVLTDEKIELDKNISNICYNKTSICDKNITIIPLLQNNNTKCLNIKYHFNKIIDDKINKITEHDIIDIVNKNNDKALRIKNGGKYEIKFNLLNVKLSKIQYKFSGLLRPVDKIEVKLTDIDSKNTKSLDIASIPNERISKEVIIEESFLNNRTINNIVTFTIECKYGFVLNYIEMFGETIEKKFKIETTIKNNFNNTFKPVNINNSVISKTENLKNNYVKIKQIIMNDTEDSDENKNILNVNYNKITINNVSSTDTKHQLMLIFNPLLNTYMFYIKDNRYLNINDTFYFNLIKTESTNNKYNVFYIQSFNDSNLYVNVVNSKVILGSHLQKFTIMNIKEIPNIASIISYNNLFNNNIIYNFDSKVVKIINADNTDNYFDVQAGSLQNNSNTPKALILKQVEKNEWQLINKNFPNQTSIIKNLKNIENNSYVFDYDNIEQRCIIILFNTYDKLKIKTNTDIKNNIAFKDIDKTINSVKRYEKELVRNKKYRNYKHILDIIYLDSIFVLKMESSYLSMYNNTIISSTDLNNEDNYFIEVKVGQDLYKLWSVAHKKYVVFDIINNKFIVSKNETEYNDIDNLNDIDVLSVFQKIFDEITGLFTYKLYYYNIGGNIIYLNLNDIFQPMGISNELIYEYNNETFKDNKYIDYCEKNCRVDNKLENNLMLNNLYLLEENDDQLYISLGKYTVRIKEIHPSNKYYFNIDNISINTYENEIKLTDFKEHKILKELFKIESNDVSTKELKMTILTVNISPDTTQVLYNLIVWTDGENFIGRFENKFDKPLEELYINKDIDIIYDSNYNKFEFNNNKSYKFTSYTNPPPDKKYIKLQSLSMDIIKMYKIALYHINNEKLDSTISDEITDDTKSNLRKILSTCSWGNCPDYDNLTDEQLTKFNNNITQFEQIYKSKQSGGQLDKNMIRFIKSIDTNLDFYKNSATNKTKFVSNDFTYYKNNKLIDILFKKNDNLELHKVFGSKGWTNSYNSIYSKKIFSINKNTNIIDTDYYDSFRNIYPVSWLERKFAINAENQWKFNNWFEDSPHFRSLPNWKFEEAQIIETKDNNGNKFQVTLGGKQGHISRRHNKKNKNNTNYSNMYKYLYLIIFIVIVFIYLYLNNFEFKNLINIK